MNLSSYNCQVRLSYLKHRHLTFVFHFEPTIFTQLDYFVEIKLQMVSLIIKIVHNIYSNVNSILMFFPCCITYTNAQNAYMHLYTL